MIALAACVFCVAACGKKAGLVEPVPQEKQEEKK